MNMFKKWVIQNDAISHSWNFCEYTKFFLSVRLIWIGDATSIITHSAPNHLKEIFLVIGFCPRDAIFTRIINDNWNKYIEIFFKIFIDNLMHSHEKLCVSSVPVALDFFTVYAWHKIYQIECSNALKY